MLRSDNSLKVNHKQADPWARRSIDPTGKLALSTPSKEVYAALMGGKYLRRQAGSELRTLRSKVSAGAAVPPDTATVQKATDSQLVTENLSCPEWVGKPALNAVGNSPRGVGIPLHSVEKEH